MSIHANYMPLGPIAFKSHRKNKSGENVFPIEWRGEQIDLPIYKVRFDALASTTGTDALAPIYVKAVRVAMLTLKNSWISDFSQESLQSTLRTILENEKVQRKEALEKFSNGEKLDFTKPLISTHDGRVINGNQRLSIFTQLVLEDPGKYGHLEYPYIAILPDDGHEVDYRKIEISGSGERTHFNSIRLDSSRPQPEG